jgi:hypothetical protein
MAQLPLPERGQPLDVTYVYQMANAINYLDSAISVPATYRYVTVDAGPAGKQSVRTSESRIIGGYVSINNNTSVTASEEKDFFYDFSTDFKYAPIVVATVVNAGGTDAGRDMSVIIKPPSTNKVEGSVRFNKGGIVTAGVNLIIIGIPN